jgi:hypothetical protein
LQVVQVDHFSRWLLRNSNSSAGNFPCSNCSSVEAFIARHNVVQIYERSQITIEINDGQNTRQKQTGKKNSLFAPLLSVSFFCKSPVLKKGLRDIASKCLTPEAEIVTGLVLGMNHALTFCTGHDF